MASPPPHAEFQELPDFAKEKIPSNAQTRRRHARGTLKAGQTGSKGQEAGVGDIVRVREERQRTSWPLGHMQ